MMTTQQVQLYPVRMVLLPTFQPNVIWQKKNTKLVETKGQKKEVENTEAPAQKEIKPEIPKKKENRIRTLPPRRSV